MALLTMVALIMRGCTLPAKLLAEIDGWVIALLIVNGRKESFCNIQPYENVPKKRVFAGSSAVPVSVIVWAWLLGYRSRRPRQGPVPVVLLYVAESTQFPLPPAGTVA